MAERRVYGSHEGRRNKPKQAAFQGFLSALSPPFVAMPLPSSLDRALASSLASHFDRSTGERLSLLLVFLIARLLIFLLLPIEIQSYRSSHYRTKCEV